MGNKRAIDWTLADIKALLSSKEQENLMLEYKSSLAIGEWTDSKRDELAKDLCAFANSAGGIIVIGICEENHRPAIIDSGVDTSKASKEAVESALQARISPRIDDLTIKEIPNPEAPGFSYYVFGIPRSLRAPHMCNSFHRYYKRYNFECVPMEHYEVEDVRRRQSEPALNFTWECRHETLPSGEEIAALYAGVHNMGSVTAQDVLVRLYLPRWAVQDHNWEADGVSQHQETSYEGIAMHRYDVYLRDSAGPIPIFPHDDQPYLITFDPTWNRRNLQLVNPAKAGGADHPGTHMIIQLFAVNMRMKRIEIPLTAVWSRKQR